MGNRRVGEGQSIWAIDLGFSLGFTTQRLLPLLKKAPPLPLLKKAPSKSCLPPNSAS